MLLVLSTAMGGQHLPLVLQSNYRPPHWVRYTSYHVRTLAMATPGKGYDTVADRPTTYSPVRSLRPVLYLDVQQHRKLSVHFLDILRLQTLIKALETLLSSFLLPSCSERVCITKWRGFSCSCGPASGCDRLSWWFGHQNWPLRTRPPNEYIKLP